MGQGNPAATLAETGLQREPRGSAHEVVAEKAQSLTVPWAAQGRGRGTGWVESSLGHRAPEDRGPGTCRLAWRRLRKWVPAPRCSSLLRLA